MSPASLTPTQIPLFLLFAQRTAEPPDCGSDLANCSDTSRAEIRVWIIPVERLVQRLERALVPVQGQAARPVLWYALERAEQGCQDSVVPDAEGAQDRFEIHQMGRIRALCMRPQYGLESGGADGYQGFLCFFCEKISIALISQRCQECGDRLVRTEIAEENGGMDGCPPAPGSYGYIEQRSVLQDLDEWHHSIGALLEDPLGDLGLQRITSLAQRTTQPTL
jgi:hypothetical protein